MNKDYTQFGIENYILKITGVFNYDKDFLKKAKNSDYIDLKYINEDINYFKDYFYPDFRKQFFSNDPLRHEILIRKNAVNPIVDLCKGDKKVQLKITESRLDLFDEGFGLFTLNLKIHSKI